LIGTSSSVVEYFLTIIKVPGRNNLFFLFLKADTSIDEVEAGTSDSD
jgi:hypothetical protein